MLKRTFTSLAEESAEIQERCRKFTEREDAKQKDWSAETVWEKAQTAAEICKFQDVYQGLALMEESVDLGKIPG